VKIKIQRDGKVACVLIVTGLGRGNSGIMSLRTEPEYKRRGLARLAMDRVERTEDGMQKRLIVAVEPDGSDDGMTEEQIRDWLSRRGYKPGRHNFGSHIRPNVKTVMIREPKKWKPMKR
jgi:hypothetical protein